MKQLHSVDLVEALGVRAGDLISLVGGGGKTTLMYRLVDELGASGLRVAAATTTKISPPTPQDPCTLLLSDTYDELRAGLANAPGPLVLGRGLLSAEKVAGIPPEWCDRLLADGELDCLVVEADGAARKPLKAPAEWEPVVPVNTSLFVAVIGLSCLGTPLDPAHVFRPELVARATGLAPGTEVTATALARLLTAPEGLSKGCPTTARAAAVLNQADDSKQLASAREIAAATLRSGEIYNRLLVAALRHERMVREVWVR